MRFLSLADAVTLMLTVAAGELGEGEVADWPRQHVDPPLAEYE